MRQPVRVVLSTCDARSIGHCSCGRAGRIHGRCPSSRGELRARDASKAEDGLQRRLLREDEVVRSPAEGANTDRSRSGANAPAARADRAGSANTARESANRFTEGRSASRKACRQIAAEAGGSLHVSHLIHAR